MAGLEGVFVSKDERNKFEVIQDFLNKRVTRAEAATALNCSERNISRQAKRVAESGLEGVVHGNRGREPWNKAEQELLDQARELVLGPYQNFNITHAHEFITEKHALKIGYFK